MSFELGHECSGNGREVESGGYLSGGGAAVALDMNLSEGPSSYGYDFRIDFTRAATSAAGEVG